MNKLLLLFALALVAGISSAPRDAYAHCDDLPHRHYAGRIYYIVCNQYYEPVWCDGWGTLRTLGCRPWTPQKLLAPAKAAKAVPQPRGETAAESLPPARLY